MWTFDDASLLDMDSRRGCPSYGVGFDACDPLGSVLELSGRGPARILRRRCRSEGVDRSPYEDASREHRSADGRERTRALPNKSYFTLNSSEHERFHHECSLPVAQNGDFIMANEQNRFQGYQPGKSKHSRKSPIRPLLVTTMSNTKVDDSRLPKVEELFEKVDHDMMDVQVMKQPLKSILNNPLPKSPPPGILKKPKNKTYQDPKSSLEGRRRQRASSESDNLYCNFHIGSPISGYDSRLSYLTNNTKRAKDNSGTGYSYGSAIASLSTAPQSKSPSYKNRCGCKEPHNGHPEDVHMHVLRTTAITNDIDDEPDIELSHQDTPTPSCPAVSPALPVSSVTAVPVAKKLVKTVKKKAKPKTKKMKSTSKIDCSLIEEAEDAHSRSPSPDAQTDPWMMDTDVSIEVEKIEKVPPTSPAYSPASVPTPAHAPVNAHAPVSPHAPGHASTAAHSPSLAHAPSSAHAPAPAPAPPPVSLKEDNSVTKLSTKLNGTAVTKKINSKESPLNLPETISSCLRPSLFPRVPPYLKFIGYEEAPLLKIPLPIQKHLKWKLTTITPIVVQKTLTNSGFRLVKSECDTAECPQEETVEWIGIWGKHMKSLMFRAIKDGQKMNHFPGTFQIGRKDRLWRNLQKLSNKYGIDEFGIMPKTYVLPHDMKLLKHDWQKYSANNEKWIIKPIQFVSYYKVQGMTKIHHGVREGHIVEDPAYETDGHEEPSSTIETEQNNPASARGTGIKVVSRWTQIPKKRPVVVQRYISKPYLINGNKFDLRLYVLVTSVHPLRIYLYKDGLARFASVKYNEDLTSLNDRYMHLTNYSINRLSKNYTPNEDFNSCEGHKWTLQTLFQYLKTEKQVDTDALWESITDLIIKTIISGEASISSLTKANITSRYNCYELFGIDVLLDEDLKPWLLEVNISPSLHSASPLDKHVKGPLVTTVLNIAQFQVPVKTNLEMLAKDKPHKLAGLPYDSRLYTMYLSKEERDKHIIYTNMEDRDMYLRDILSTLTPDDVRHLLQAEDELTQARDMQRVFPTAHTHKYLGYLTGPRYYNRLFDAWESRYAEKRAGGIELLRNLCDIGYHLEVPPVPLKNDVDAPSPPASERASVPSLVSLEAGARPCGDAAHARPAPPPPPLEPRA